MPQNIVLDWTLPTPTPIDGVVYPKDTLGRVKYAQYLTNFLASKGYDESREGEDRKRNYVLNLNSEWGSGKTYFLRRWAEDLKAHHPVVYVDAWQQDYSDDPLMTVISSMVSQLREQAGRAEDKAAISVIGKAGGLFKALAPAVVGGVTKKFTGIDFAAVMNDAEEATAESDIKGEDGNALDMSAAASKAVQYMLNEHEGKAKAISALKESVSQWLGAVIGHTDKHYPAFVFIDELDRCRPSYAVEMLETIKHIFNIKGVVFVVATDTDQLQHAVKAVYGEGFDAGVYLGRFFDARYTLREADYETLLFTHCDMNRVTEESMLEKGIEVWPKCSTISNEVKNLSAIYHSFNLSAREAIQTTERLMSVIENLKYGSRLNYCYLAILMCFKEKEPTQFNKLQRGESKADNLEINARRTLVFHLTPNAFFSDFIVKEDRFTSLRVSNAFQTQSVVIRVADFFNTIHPAFINWIDPNWDYSQLASVARSGSWECETANYAENWLSYGNVLNTLGTVNHDSAMEQFQNAESRNRPPEFFRYKDLVELSTDLDV